MTEHAALPTLCPDCHILALALADGDPRPYVIRWCEHRRTIAIGYKRGASTVVAWDLHAVPTDEELKRFAPLLTDLYATGQVAAPSTMRRQ